MSEKRQVVNIVNFIRAVEPREPVDLPLVVREQIALMQRLNLRGTFLLQYDALILPEYSGMLKALDPEQFEIGVWFEIVEPMVKKAGIPWTGRWSWDWHVHCGFSLGYTKEQREQLVDVLYEDFRAIFGYYPRVFGSWLFDTHTVRYISEKYGVDAVCNCKEQFGTDGYTLWGGYYGQAYYPSRTNVFMPAQTAEEQMDAPLFRMLGSDQVYQFDFGVDLQDGANPCQGVITLEPVYLKKGGGGDPKWVEWFLKENYNGECLSFGYAQAGQENSFGWPAIGPGLTSQCERFARLQAEGKLVVEPLGDTGRWFKRTYASTPPSAITAHGAYDDPEKDSVWYCTKFYRTNLYRDHGALRIRDIHLFDERLPDAYEDTVCPGNDASYETLPVVDGNRHSGSGRYGGLYLLDAAGAPLQGDAMTFADLGGGRARVGFGCAEVLLEEDRMTVSGQEGLRLEAWIAEGAQHVPEVAGISDKELRLRYGGAEYSVRLEKGTFCGPRAVLSEGGVIRAVFACCR